MKLPRNVASKAPNKAPRTERSTAQAEHALRSKGLRVPLLAALLATSSATFSGPFVELPQSVRQTIERLCVPLAFSRDRSSYRSCVNSKTADGLPDTAVEKLSFDEKFAVEKFCSATASSSSANFQLCTEQEVRALSSLTAPHLVELMEEEKHAIRQSCYSVQETGGGSRYRQCLNNALIELKTYPAIDLSILGRNDRNIVTLSCAPNNGGLEVRDYRRCLANEVSRLQQQPSNANNAASLQAIKVATAGAIPNAVTATALSNDAASNKPARVISKPQARDAVVAASETPMLAQNTNVEADSNEIPMATIVDPVSGLETRPTAPLNTARVAAAAQDRDDNAAVVIMTNSVDSNQDTDTNLGLTDTTTSTPSTTAQTENGTIADKLPLLNQPIPEWIPEPLATWLGKAGIDNVSKLGFLLIPLAVLLLLVPVLIRQKNTDDYDDEHTNPHDQDDENSNAAVFSQEDFAYLDESSDTTYPATGSKHSQISDSQPLKDAYPSEKPYAPEPLQPGPYTSEPTHRPNEAQHQNPTGNALSNSDLGKTWANPESPQQAEPEQQHVELHNNSAERQEYSEQKPDSEALSVEDEDAFSLSDIDNYSAWLQQLSIENQQRYCIEFLLYWVSFGEKNYDKSLHLQLDEQVKSQSLIDVHTGIKSVVLRANSTDLQSTLNCINTTFSLIHKEQTLKLLLTILVRGNEASTVQNVILRFLSDYIAVGTNTLAVTHEEFFGKALPDMPRPDRTKWWQKHAPTEVGDNPIDQASSILGVDSPATSEQVEKAFKLAIHRHGEQHYRALGEKERNLIARHLEKSTQAYELLEEVEA